MSSRKAKARSKCQRELFVPSAKELDAFKRLGTPLGQTTLDIESASSVLASDTLRPKFLPSGQPQRLRDKNGRPLPLRDTQEEMQVKLGGLVSDTVTSMKKLLPCPLCGSFAFMEMTFMPQDTSPSNRYYRIRCGHLGYTQEPPITTAWHRYSDLAVREWQLTRKLEQ